MSLCLSSPSPPYSPPICIEVEIGSSTSNFKTVTVPGVDTCPDVINNTNWLGDFPHADSFNISVSGDQVTATRTDAQESWGMILRFTCTSTRIQGQFTCNSSVLTIIVLKLALPWFPLLLLSLSYSHTHTHTHIYIFRTHSNLGSPGFKPHGSRLCRRDSL